MSFGDVATLGSCCIYLRKVFIVNSFCSFFSLALLEGIWVNIFYPITNCFIILPSQYNCTAAPFEINGVAYAWWNDRNGDPQYFWSGSNMQ